MMFRYRYVTFGTKFQSAVGVRTDSGGAPEKLFENEMALDVGSAPWGDDAEVRAIVDNHFYPHRYPSAAAGVLHLAERIQRHFADRAQTTDPIWLVTHRQPDFDAFCAMYLARCVISGAIEPSGWAEYGVRADAWQHGRHELDWFSPDVGRMPLARRWPVLLAAYASCVDKCHPIRCPRHRGLHSVLYAALLRGRPYLEESNGAWQFFSEVQQALADTDRALNPLFDSVLESSSVFAPELALLDRQQDAYERDLRRARRSIVLLQQAEIPFAQWYLEAASMPLALPSNEGPQIQPLQLAPAGQRRRQADGIYLRDPECLLFKDWVRNDLEASSMRKGFLFTAIAYSHERPDSTKNETSYYFSIDPERAEGCHLYNVWAQLQVQELRALEEFPAVIEVANARPCRPGYEARATTSFAMQFDDPWFDGSNYEATIIATPGRGTAIAAYSALAADLSDDPVARIVQEELELSFFQGDLKVWELSSAANMLPAAGQQHDAPPVAQYPSTLSMRDVLHGTMPRAPLGTWRFARIDLNDDLDVFAGTVAEQIGRMFWHIIDADNRTSVPTDFVEHHLIRKSNWVGVWSRDGIVIATKSDAAEQADRVQQLCQELSSVATAIDELSRRSSGAEELLVEGDELLRRVVRIKFQLTVPENHLVRRFFEAIRLDEVLQMLRDINAAATQRAEAESNRKHLAHQQEIATKLQNNLERITAIQRIVHAIEYLIVPYYAVMLWGHFLPEYAEGWILLVPAALSIGLIAVVNHSVEQHWVEWAFFRGLMENLRRRDSNADRPREEH
jgi:hypothetical protein